MESGRAFWHVLRITLLVKASSAGRGALNRRSCVTTASDVCRFHEVSWWKCTAATLLPASASREHTPANYWFIPKKEGKIWYWKGQFWSSLSELDDTLALGVLKNCSTKKTKQISQLMFNSAKERLRNGFVVGLSMPHHLQNAHFSQ